MAAMRRKNKISLLSLAVMAIVILSMFGYVNKQLSPVDSAAGKTVSVTIAQGDSTMTIATSLEQAGLIRNAKLFYYYARATGHGSDFRAGNYTFSAVTGRAELIQVLTGNKRPSLFGTRVTIPEGYTAKQIAARLEVKGVANAGEFLAVIKQPGSFNGEAIKLLQTNTNQLIPLEGYMFPETYTIPKNSTEQEIAQTMVDQLDVQLAELPKGWEEQLKKHNVSFHQMMTIASLIEREVVVPEERAIVASVIYNRLRIGQALQIDATVQYLLSKQKERLLYADLEVESPYNTYKQNGLPPGPIASPSLASIKAALYPATTNYFYYVTKKDGTSAHLFATTYKEHLNNISKSKQ
jgi:UPF0755 protein